MNLHKCIFTNNDCYKKNVKIKPKGVMVHSTGANNPSLKRYVQPDDGLLGDNLYNNDWNRSGLSVCVHAFIGKLSDGTVATYQVLPWDHRGWHAGGSANNTHISFEICEDGLKDEKYFSSIYKESVELTAHLCEMYGLDPLADGVVIDHKEGSERGIASGHGDVGHWFPKFGKTMDDFRKDVKAKVEENKRSGNNPTKYYKEATEWAINKGIFRGDGKGNYYWKDNVTREQLAQVLYNINRMESL